MKLHTPFNQKGFGHIELLILVVFVAIFAFVGVKVLTASHADALLTSSTCQLRGRVWANNGCTKSCLSGAGSHVVADPYDYCSNALSKISSSTCSSLGRKYINVGCARRWQQTNLLNAYQCLTGGTTYTVASPYDKCVVAVATTKGSCSIISPASIKSGTVLAPVIAKFTNTGTVAFTITYGASNVVDDGKGHGRGGSEGITTNGGVLAPGASKNIVINVGGFTVQKNTTDVNYAFGVTTKSPSFTCSRTYPIQ